MKTYDDIMKGSAYVRHHSMDIDGVWQDMMNKDDIHLFQWMDFSKTAYDEVKRLRAIINRDWCDRLNNQ